MGRSKRLSYQGDCGACSPTSGHHAGTASPCLACTQGSHAWCAVAVTCARPGHASASLGAGQVSKPSVLAAAMTRSRRHCGQHRELGAHRHQALQCPRPASCQRRGCPCPRQRWGLPASARLLVCVHEQVWELLSLPVCLSGPAGSPAPHRPCAPVPGRGAPMGARASGQGSGGSPARGLVSRLSFALPSCTVASGVEVLCPRPCLTWPHWELGHPALSLFPRLGANFRGSSSRALWWSLRGGSSPILVPEPLALRDCRVLACLVFRHLGPGPWWDPLSVLTWLRGPFLLREHSSFLLPWPPPAPRPE